MSTLKAKGGRQDIEFRDASAASLQVMREVPVTERAGYPLIRVEGSADPAEWRTKEGKEVLVDFKRAWWLPDDWGQGVKCTNRTAHSTGTSGGTYTVAMSPEGLTFYHRHAAEKHAGYTFTRELGRNGQIRAAQLQATENIQLARQQIKDLDGSSPFIGVDSDKSLFEILSPNERKCIVQKDDFHFCVVSARRATSPQGVRDIFMVQSQLVEAGVTPTWYVDEQSLSDYQRLGLTAVVGGRLTDARNMALDDAERLGKVCVQLSDDISAWEYRHGERAAAKNDDLMNAAHSAAKRYIVSPVNAAQFILAKMRGTAEPRPKLGGVYMLGSCARTFADEPVKRRHFILGDFLVVDSSPVRFDTKMTLKEDYDFSCAHIRAHGSVMRCQRMTLNVKHYSNAGGAVAVRDQSGKQEKANLDILFAKWPRAFSLNPMRKNEVRMRWPADDDAEGLNHPTVGSKLKQHGGKAKISPKSSPKPVMKKLVKKQEVPPGLPPLSAVLERASSTPKNPAIALRCKRVAGQTVARVLEGFNFKDKGANVKYRLCDLTYDLRRGHLVAKRSRATAKLGG